MLRVVVRCVSPLSHRLPVPRDPRLAPLARRRAAFRPSDSLPPPGPARRAPGCRRRPNPLPGPGRESATSPARAVLPLPRPAPIARPRKGAHQRVLCSTAAIHFSSPAVGRAARGPLRRCVQCFCVAVPVESRSKSDARELRRRGASRERCIRKYKLNKTRRSERRRGVRPQYAETLCGWQRVLELVAGWKEGGKRVVESAEKSSLSLR